MKQVSWHGRVDRKEQVLKQVAAHRAAARLGPLIVDGRAIGLYGWSSPTDLPLAGRVLGLPPVLLSIGLFLFEGFPEDPRGTREHLDGIHRFLSALPVGRELDEVGPELLSRWVLDEDWGLASTPMRPRVRGFVEGLALDLLDGREDPDTARELLRELEDEAVRTREAGGLPEMLLAELRVVRDVQPLTRLHQDPGGAYRVLMARASGAIDALVCELYGLLSTRG